jgi:FKBP-type peptidyl-prolyl cis-trans isomerase FklB
MERIVMKFLLPVLAGLGLLSGVCLAGEKLELESPKEKESYSLGYQFGENLEKQGVAIDLDVYTSGIRDALGGKEPQMGKEEIRATLTNLRQRLMAEQQKALQEKAEKNLAEGKAFLAENGKKEGVKTLPSRLQFRILKEGSGRYPKAGDMVSVNYRGSFIDGKEFDSSYKKGKAAEIQVDGVIPGWTEALKMMKEGSKWQLFVPSELGYGQRGQGLIPPNSALIFEIELISVK